MLKLLLLFFFFFKKRKFLSFLLIYNLFFRYYYADFDKAQEKVTKMIKDKEWNINEINQNLLKIFDIENPNKTANNNEALLKKLLERVEKLENMVNNK